MGIVVEIVFVDYGYTNVVKRNTILAPLASLTSFFQPPYGIPCLLEEAVNIPLKSWKIIIEANWIKVNIGPLLNDRFLANLTSDSDNGTTATKLWRIKCEQRSSCWVAREVVKNCFTVWLKMHRPQLPILAEQ
jgi:hypothetical protein